MRQILVLSYNILSDIILSNIISILSNILTIACIHVTEKCMNEMERCASKTYQLIHIPWCTLCQISKFYKRFEGHHLISSYFTSTFI